MPFVGPLKGACPGLCPQKARRHSLLKKKHKRLLFSDSKLRVILLNKKAVRVFVIFLTLKLCVIFYRIKNEAYLLLIKTLKLCAIMRDLL